MRKHMLIASLVLVVGALAPSTAQAFPWDIDLVDSAFLRAYEWEMMLPPEGAIPTAAPYASIRQPELTISSRTIYREACEPSCKEPAATLPVWDRNTPEGVALDNPLDVNGQTADAVLQTGERMFSVYCAACHGAQGGGGAPVADTNVKGRYPAGPPKLSGDGNSSKSRSDGYIFLTIRNGGNIMPSYSYAMSDEEIWSVVSYIRTLPQATYTP